MKLFLSSILTLLITPTVFAVGEYVPDENHMTPDTIQKEEAEIEEQEEALDERKKQLEKEKKHQDVPLSDPKLLPNERKTMDQP
ncbi:hypothetical protein [Peredibacter starrii]|uniref:Uncharacterized protein n=1 Tax=Peredibacter starrii TaxID=28202 RepID=A0AAX4HUQ5_9BACT|nr:hypothetical protein [Peredibacter starrii]WPU66923.1 hypothetical protein SOO65_09190 [Peredibacter starrii]